MVDLVLADLTQHGDAQAARAMLGPPGSGKSATLKALIAATSSCTERILLCTPTGALAEDYRPWQSEHIAVDTLDAAFQTWQPEGAWLLLPYDLIIIDEIGFVDWQKFERVMWHWDHNGRWPVLLFAGDFEQLTPPSGLEAAHHSCRWRDNLGGVARGEKGATNAGTLGLHRLRVVLAQRPLHLFELVPCLARWLCHAGLWASGGELHLLRSAWH